MTKDILKQYHEGEERLRELKKDKAKYAEFLKKVKEAISGDQGRDTAV